MNSNFSAQLRAARIRLNLTQAQAAELWEIPLRTLQAWEKGVRRPRRFSLPSLHQFLTEPEPE